MSEWASEPPRIFITGARGFIGKALAARFRGAGWQVRGVDLVADPSAGVLAGDIGGPGEWQDAMAGSDVVIHTAALVSNAAKLEQAWRLNVMGTRLVLDGAGRGRVGRFVHFSSVRAFSDLAFPDGVDEHHPVRTDGNPYVDTKVAGEQVVLQAHAAGEIACTIIRPGDVYGPGSRPWTILPVLAIKANQFVLPAMGKGIFSPVYVENLVDGVQLAVSRPEAAGQVFTVSDGTSTTCREFFGHYYRMLAKRGPICLPTSAAVALARANQAVSSVRGRESEASAATIRYFARPGGYSIAKARRELGYEPKIDLADGMQRTETWLRAQGML